MVKVIKVVRFNANFMFVGWLVLCLLLGAAARVVSAGQEKGAVVAAVAATATPTPAVTPDPLALTADEISEIGRIGEEMKPLTEESARVYQSFLTAKTSAERCRFADQLWISIKQLEPFQAKQNEWLARVRKAHNCEDCPVDNGKLIKLRGQ